MRRTGALALIIIILGSTILPGCWSRREIESLLMTTIIGFDKVNIDGVEKWQVTVKAGSGQRKKNGQQSGEGPTGGTDIIFKGIGDTPLDADRDLQARIPKQGFYGFVTAIIIGEKAAEEGISPILDLKLRYREFRINCFIMVCKGEAFKILQSSPEMVDTLALEIDELGRHKAEKIGVSYGTDVSEVAQALLSPYKDPVCTHIELVYPGESLKNGVKQSIILRGLGMFRGDKLVGWLNEGETTGYLLVRGLNRATAPVPIILNQDKSFTYLVHKSSSKIQPVVNNDKISYNVTIKTVGEVAEVHGLELESETEKEFEQLTAEKIQALVQKTFEQELNCDADIFGLKQIVHAKNYKKWKALSPESQKGLTQADVHITVDATIALSGKLNKSFKVQEE